MDFSKIDLYMSINEKYFEKESLAELREKLKNTNNDLFLLLNTLELKNPICIFFISLTLGFFGVDRFIIGDTKKGLLKLFTLGGFFGFFTAIDWFIIMKITKKRNLKKVLDFIN